MLGIRPEEDGVGRVALSAVGEYCIIGNRLGECWGLSGNWHLAMEPGTVEDGGRVRSPREKTQIVCRRENVWCWDVVGAV